MVHRISLYSMYGTFGDTHIKIFVLNLLCGETVIFNIMFKNVRLFT